MLKVVYTAACPNCNGNLEAERALLSMPCSRCLKEEGIGLSSVSHSERVKAIYNLLVSNNSLKNYWNIYYKIENYEEIINYFKKIVKSEPWSLQKLWLRRLIDGENFTMSAPTGLGKSTTISLYSTYLGRNVVYIVPTKSLVDQTCKKIREFGGDVSCGALDEGKVSVITTNYLSKHKDELGGMKTDLVAVDDADAIIKSGKTTDFLVKLLGIPDLAYENALKLVRLKKYLINVSGTPDEDFLKKRIRELEASLISYRGIYSQLVISSATLRPKGLKQQAVKFLTGFEPSSVQMYSRNIIDAKGDLDISILHKLGPGGLILVSRDYGKKMINELKERVEEYGLRVDVAISGRKFMEKLSRGETDVIIGSASYYGVAVRGIDEPTKIKYVLFYGVPKIKISLETALLNPFTLLKVMKAVGLNDHEFERKVMSLSISEAQAIKISLLKKQEVQGDKLKVVAETVLKYKDEVVSKIRSSMSSKIVTSGLVIVGENKGFFIEFPDVTTYLQGSGRSSRLYNGGLTLGLSVVLSDDKELLDMLEKRLRSMVGEFHFQDVSSLNMEETIEKLDSCRKPGGETKKLDVVTSLMIVESPTKAKTIARMFGRPSMRIIGGVPVYETIVVDGNKVNLLDIMATRGHITDLTLDSVGYYGVEVKEDGNTEAFFSKIKRCYNCKRTFSEDSEVCPYCGSTDISSTESTVEAMRKLAMEVDQILIATDPDIEGEKIGFDVASFVSPFNSNIKRIKYHEVTKNGVLSAIRSPSTIDVNTVKAQVARRIEDRWIGFELSTILKARFNGFNYGAGRVQTPVLGWIANTTKDYKANMGYLVYANIDGKYIMRRFYKEKNKAKEFVKMNETIKVLKDKEDTVVISPLPPFTTETLLVEANQRFKLPASAVMKIAQDLFEAGLITYHRTESVHVSPSGIEVAKAYLKKIALDGEFSGRSWGQEGTHEAIRPTKPVSMDELKQEVEDNPYAYFIKFTKFHFLIYDLIFRRFMASQMRNAIGKRCDFRIVHSEGEEKVTLTTSAEGGFSKIYDVRTVDLTEGEKKPSYEIKRGSYSRLLSQADLILMMKEKGIGRPSTYSKTLDSVLRHGYVISSKKRYLLVATKKGINVFEFLDSKFKDLVSEKRTSDLLSRIDLISSGQLDPSTVVLDIYKEIKSSVNLLNS